jgi:ribonuclease HII
VFAAAVILDPCRPIRGIADSKTLSARRRSALAVRIRKQALAWAIGRAEVDEIDRYNILRASLMAMSRAVGALGVEPQLALIDGLHCPELACETRAVVRGDARVPAISAASILAKVARDAEMVTLDRSFPAYGFARHKGYPTPAHRRALAQFGACPIHRRSFVAVQGVLAL